MIKVHEAIAQALTDQGTKVLFGLIGDGNLFMVDAFMRRNGGRYVAAANESGAVLMAVGMAQTSGSVAVATVTHGPALLNTLTGLAEGVRARMPVVLVAGDTAGDARDHLQKISQRELVVATGAGFESLRSAATVGIDVATAFRRARAERRPIVLNVPIDLQWQDVEYMSHANRAFDPNGSVLEGADIDDAVGIIATARRPVVLAGRGACSEQARAALIRLADRIGAPLATTLKAKDLFSGESGNLGVFGTLSSPATADVIARSDCVIAFGAGLNQFTSGRGGLLKGKRVVHIHQEAGEIGRYEIPTAAVVGDAGRLARHIVELLDGAEIEPSGFRDDEMLQALAQEQKAHADLLAREAAEAGSQGPTVEIGHALRALAQCVPADRVFVTDGGRFIGEAWRAFSVEHPGLFVHTVNFGSIGLGMGEAIGASFGQPGRVTLLVVGDGGFMNGGLTEFNTAVREKVDLVVVVCNDSNYGAEHIQFVNRDLDPSISAFEWPELAPLADALGGTGVTVRSVADLQLARRAIEQRDRPVLIDIKLDANKVASTPH